MQLSLDFVTDSGRYGQRLETSTKMSSTQKFGDLVGAIDEGTSSARFVLFKLGTSDIICFHQLEIRNITPHEGWVEQSPVDILDTVRLCIEKTIEQLISLGGSPTVNHCDYIILCKDHAMR